MMTLLRLRFLFVQVPGLRPNGAHRFHNYNHAPLCDLGPLSHTAFSDSSASRAVGNRRPD